MKNWFTTDLETIASIGLSALGIYVAVITLTRIFGKRSFSKMSSFDFAATIAIGSIIASTLLSGSVSLSEGAFGLACIFLLQGLIAYLRKYKRFRKLVDNSPMLLMNGREILWNNMRKAKVTEDDLKAKLREANVIDKEQILAVIFESTGDIAVLHSSDTNKKIDEWLMGGVNN